MTRPAFGGNTIATIACPDNRPQMATVRPGVMQKIAPSRWCKSRSHRRVQSWIYTKQQIC